MSLLSELEPILGGYTSKELWDTIHLIVLPGWFLLFVAPKWKYTHMFTLIPPLFEAMIYLVSFVQHIRRVDGGSSNDNMFSMESIVTAFRHPDFVFVGWIHYLCFDLLVGRGIVLDAVGNIQLSGVPLYMTLIPCLFLTFMLGPVGFLLYCTIRYFILPKEQPLPDFKAKTT